MPFEQTIRLEQPPVFIVNLSAPCRNLNALNALLEQIKSNPLIHFANPVFKENNQEAYLLNEVFVKVKTVAGKEKLTALSKELNFTFKEYSYSKNIYVLEPEKSCRYHALELSQILSKNPEFVFAEPNVLFSPVVTSSDPLYNRQWHLKNTGTPLQGSGTAGADISIEDAWTITMGDPSIKVAILDSGVDTTHAEFAGNLMPGIDATGGGSNGFPSLNFSSDAHGTACAGIVAAKANNGFGGAGIAPECKIIPVKIFYYVDNAMGLNFNPPIPFSTSQWLADGIHFAWQVAGADVMSNSWAVPDILFSMLQGPISIVEDAINDAFHYGRGGKGVPQFFSSGNDNSELLWPSRLESTIAVTATSMCDERKSPTSCDGENWGGNYGNMLDFAAPGVKITTSDIWGSKGYDGGHYTTSFNGTSAACPVAAGIAALMLSVRPELNAWDVRYLLGISADKVGGYDYSGTNYAGSWSNELGFGRLNAFAALQATAVYTSINSELKEVKNWSVYPNPVTDGIIQLELSMLKPGMINYTLSDLSGKIIFRQNEKITEGNHHFQIKVNAPSGIYLLKVATQNETYQRKLLFLDN